jgi:tetratricopeptide (TPR) repeat protein
MTSIDQTGGSNLESAVRHHRAGRLREAVAAYEELLRRAPNDADLMQLLGVALAQLERHEDGARLLAHSLEIKPDRPTVLLNLAQALRALGREEDALRCCDRALALDGSLAGAYRMRAAALMALGRREQALASYGQSVRLAPADAAAHADLGVALEAVGRSRDAFDCFARAIALDPNLAAAQHNHGILAARFGQHARALQSFDHALALLPHQAVIHNNRGNALKELGRLPEALQSYTLALAIEPGNAETLHNRAVVHALLGQHAEALQDYDNLLARDAERAPDLIGRGGALVALQRNAEALIPLERAIALLPGDAEAHIQHGVALLRLKRHAEALASFDRALAIQSDLPEVLTNRGVALVALDRPEEALVSFERSLALNGAPADTYTNLGVVLRSLGRYREAASNFARTLARKPGDPAARLALAFVHLTLGDFNQGWPLYEARFEESSLAAPARDFGVPRWHGREVLCGKTLLVHAEQGLGDAMQFCRYLPRLAAQGIAIVFEVMPQLKALMQSLPGAVQLIGRGEQLPALDYHCPLLSLPLALRTELTSIPADVPYLAAQPQRVAAWSARLQAIPGLRVGLCWQGNPMVEQLVWARGRSMPLAALAPLTKVPGVSFVVLQKGPGSEQLREVAFRDHVIDLGSDFDAGPDAFLDTAAVMAGLDLVITTDTAVAHLAGALARPTWLVLPAIPEWRWLLERSDSPWYPTMQLFRQRRRGDWDEVIGVAAAALASLAAGRRSGSQVAAAP